MGPGLSDYTLTAEEQEILDEFDDLEFKDYNVVNIFNNIKYFIERQYRKQWKNTLFMRPAQKTTRSSPIVIQFLATRFCTSVPSALNAPGLTTRA